MLTTIRPLLRPLPLLSTTGLILAATFTTSTFRSTQATISKTMPSPTSWPTKSYTPRHTTWPYSPQDFTRQDPSPDPSFYSSPRFVTHIDDDAIATLRAYYSTVLPTQGRILDFCSSWISHYPPAIEAAAEKGELKVVGLGMNEAELEANDVLNDGRILKDLNVDPEIPLEEGVLDASTNVVSTDYLTQPVEVLRSLLRCTKVGGTVHLTISNRCFPTKAIARWLRVGEEERVQMVGDFLWFAGWREIEIVELSDGTVEKGGEGEGAGGLGGFMALMGMSGRRDPLWVVRGKKV